MRPPPGRCIAWALLTLGALCLLLSPRGHAMMEHHFIYFPETELVMTPSTLGLDYEEVFFSAEDGTRLHGWFLEGQPGRPLVLFFHGNAGNISHRVPNLQRMHEQLGVSIFIFDYRGYGRSRGRASEEGTYSDARGALAWIKNRGRPQQKLIYFGRSLGAAVAVQLALENPPSALILETPFASIAAMGRHHNPALHFLLGWALQARYDNSLKLPSVRVPLLMLQGDRDSIVPPRMAQALFEKARPPKTFHWIRGADHNDTYETGGASYWQAWKTFIAECFPDGAE